MGPAGGKLHRDSAPVGCMLKHIVWDHSAHCLLVSGERLLSTAASVGCSQLPQEQCSRPWGHPQSVAAAMAHAQAVQTCKLTDCVKPIKCCLSICCVCPARSQTKKLHELFKAMEREKEELKRHNEQLKRHCGMGPTGTAGAGGRQVVASRQHGASGASARTALTPPFHGAAGTQMVSKGCC